MDRARRLGWLWTLLVGGALFEAVRRALITTQNPNLLPVLILLGAAVVPAAFVRFLLQRDVGYDVGAALVLRVALVGGVVGVVAAGVLEYDTLPRLQILPMVAVAVIEEAAKLIAPVAVLVATRHRLVRANGLLLGAAAGAGFAVLETMGYAFVTLIQSSGDLSAVDGVLVLRGLFSPAAHMAWTGLAAAGLWYAVGRNGERRHWWHLIGAFAVAVALHATWDSTSSALVEIILAAISLALLLTTVHALHRAHVRRLRDLPSAAAESGQAVGADATPHTLSSRA
jgi:RsiW-degrading membrane proteinase PrsW (M82 family)